nr:hypothetical protein [Tanacetum cinerariifolium]
DLYLSSKKDLSWTGLPKFVDDTVIDYSRPSPTVASSSAEADLYLSSKKDLSWTGLPKFVDDTVIDYSRPSPTVASSSAEGQNKDSSTSENVASPNPPKPFVKFVKPKDNQPESKIKEQETPKKPQVKYAKQYRHSNKRPKGNQRNWNNLKSYQLGPEFVLHKKPCFNCGDFSHLANDCKRRVQRETTRSQNHTYWSPSHRSGLESSFNGMYKFLAPCHILISLKPRIHTRVEPIDLVFLNSKIQCFHDVRQCTITEFMRIISALYEITLDQATRAIGIPSSSLKGTTWCLFDSTPSVVPTTLNIAWKIPNKPSLNTHLRVSMKREQSELTTKIYTVLKAITDRIAGTLLSDIVKNLKLGTYTGSSACSYLIINPQCSSHPSTSINAIKANFNDPIIEPQQIEEPEPTLDDEFKDLHLNLGPHDAQYCMKNPEQTFVKYASSRTDETGAITDRIAGTLLSDTVKNPKMGTHPVSPARSYPIIDSQCSSHPSTSINAIKAYFNDAIIKPQQTEEPKPTIDDEFKDLHLNLPVPKVVAHAPIYNAILDKYVKSPELGKNGSAFVQGGITAKIGDPMIFTLPYRLGDSEPFDTLADLGSCDPETPLLVGRGFLATTNAVIDYRMAKIAVGEGITRDGVWHAKVRIIDPDGEEFTKTLQSIPTTMKLSEKESPREIINLDHFYNT